MRIVPYVKFALFVVAVALTVAIADPHHRSTVARVALFALVGMIAVALVDLARQRSPAPEASPFEPGAHRAPDTGLPSDFERLALEVREMEAAPDRGESVVPAALRRTCRRIAMARVAEHHPGPLDDLDEAAVASALGPVLWGALDGQPSTLDPDGLATELEQL